MTGMRLEARRRDQIKVRLTPAERAAVEERATATGRSIAVLLRELALGYTPKSMLDQRVVHDLVKVNADQGRLGGLLKLWLTERPGEGASTVDVRRVLGDIEETQILLRSLVQRL